MKKLFTFIAISLLFIGGTIAQTFTVTEKATTSIASQVGISVEEFRYFLSREEVIFYFDGEKMIKIKIVKPGSEVTILINGIRRGGGSTILLLDEVF